MTRQETEIFFSNPEEIKETGDHSFEVYYSDLG